MRYARWGPRMVRAEQTPTTLLEALQGLRTRGCHAASALVPSSSHRATFASQCLTQQSQQVTYASVHKFCLWNEQSCPCASLVGPCNKAGAVLASDGLRMACMTTCGTQRYLCKSRPKDGLCSVSKF